MKFLYVALFAEAAQAGSPINKVISLLQRLEKSVVAQGETEETNFSHLADWCEETARTLEFQIKTGTERSETQAAIIEKAVGSLETLGSKIQEIGASIAQDTQDVEAAERVRSEEHKNFVAEQAELKDTTSALVRAQSVLSRHSKAVPAVMLELTKSFQVLLNAHMFSGEDSNKLKAFLQSTQDDEDDVSSPSLPSVKAYESHSGSIMDTLARMQDQAEELLQELQQKEMTNQHNFEMLKQSLSNSITYADKDLSSTKKQRAEAGEVRATAQGDKTVVDKSLFEDKKTLKATEINCKSAAEEHDSSKATRVDELKALREAMRVLSEKTGDANAHVYKALLQVGSKGNSDLVFRKVANQLRSLGKKLEVSALTQMSMQVRAASSATEPFAKVKGLVKNMISKLMDEAAADADHKAFCDSEISTSEKKRDSRAEEIDRLTTRLDKASSGLASLREEVSDLQAAISRITSSQAELDKIRAEERKSYTETRSELEDGVSGVQQALKVLREYYATENESLLQQPIEFHSRSTDAATGIIGLLEVAESDFARSLAAAESTESQAQSEYEKISQDNRVTLATKKTEVQYKQKLGKQLEKQLAENGSDREGVQSELDAVLEYLEQLRAQCTVVPMSYEEKKAKREREIEGLREALSILETEAAPALLQKQSFLSRRQ